MPIIVSPLGISQQWYTLDNDEYRLKIIYSYFKKAYLSIDGKYIDLMQFKSDPLSLDLLPSEQISRLGINNINKLTSIPNMTINYAQMYNDTTFNLSTRPVTLADESLFDVLDVDHSKYTHLRAYVNHKDLDHTKLSGGTLFIVNGLIHYSQYFKNYVLINNGQTTININKYKSVGVIVFPNISELSSSKFSLNIANTANTIPHTSSSQDFILCIAGHLYHTSTGEITYDDTQIQLNYSKMNFNKKLYALSKMIKPNTLSFNLSEITDSTIITQSMLNELLQLHNSFIISTSSKIYFDVNAIQRKNNNIYSSPMDLCILPILQTGDGLYCNYDYYYTPTLEYHIDMNTGLSDIYKNSTTMQLPTNPNKYINANLIGIRAEK